MSAAGVAAQVVQCTEAWVDLAANPAALTVLGLQPGDVIETAHSMHGVPGWSYTALWNVRFLDPPAGGQFLLVESAGASDLPTSIQLKQLFPPLPTDIAGAIATQMMPTVNAFLHLCPVAHLTCGASLPNVAATMHSHMVRKREKARIKEGWASFPDQQVAIVPIPAPAVSSSESTPGCLPGWLPTGATQTTRDRSLRSSAPGGASSTLETVEGADGDTLFRVAPTRVTDGIAKMASDEAGRLYALALLGIARFLGARVGARDAADQGRQPVPSFVAYLLQVLFPNAGNRLAPKTRDELRSIAETLDEMGSHLPASSPEEALQRARVADRLTQRFKALETEGTEDAALGDYLQLTPKRSYGLASEGELEMAVTNKIRKAKFSAAVKTQNRSPSAGR